MDDFGDTDTILEHNDGYDERNIRKTFSNRSLFNSRATRLRNSKDQNEQGTKESIRKF